ncbi:MAG: Uma2 family endonuclease [Gemmataceae bacterium]|nr:Uma2 family endonuclease [Gemmataceae bacterium]
MTIQAAHLPYQGTMAGFRRFSVAEYHRLIELGILTEDDNLELLEGYLVHKMSRNPPHDAAIQKGMKRWLRLLPAGWDLRVHSAITLTESEPEPDFAVVRGDENSYLTSHPAPADIGLVVEVSDWALPGDRDDKGRIYARAGIACYWIVNLTERQIEVYSSPSGPVPDPRFGQRVDYRPGDNIPLALGGTAPIQVAAQDLLP